MAEFFTVVRTSAGIFMAADGEDCLVIFVTGVLMVFRVYSRWTIGLDRWEVFIRVCAGRNDQVACTTPFHWDLLVSNYT